MSLTGDVTCEGRCPAAQNDVATMDFIATDKHCATDKDIATKAPLHFMIMWEIEITPHRTVKARADAV